MSLSVGLRRRLWVSVREVGYRFAYNKLPWPQDVMAFAAGLPSATACVNVEILSFLLLNIATVNRTVSAIQGEGSARKPAQFELG